MTQRKMLTLYGWDATKVKIPLPKYSYWFKKTHQHRCVVSCKNYPTVIYVSDFGFATIGYCEAHAARKIMLSLLSGFNERGIWVECLKGRLVPFSGYDVIDTMLKIVTDKNILMRLKAKKAKLIQFKQSGV